MIREPRSRRRQGSSDIYNEISGSRSNASLRGFLRGQPQAVIGSPDGLEEGGVLGSTDVDSGIDHTVITMKTRVAVRDKTPHRFQVVPLRDVSRMETSSASYRENKSRPDASTMPKQTLPWVPLKTPVKPSQSKPAPSGHSAILRLDMPPSKENVIDYPVDSKLDIKQEMVEPLVSPVCPDSSFTVDITSKALIELDLNQSRVRRSTMTAPVTDMSSTSSILKLIHYESPLTHTISRSLQVRTRLDRNYPKFTSLDHIHTPVAPLHSSIIEPKGRSRTLSDAVLSQALDTSGTDDDSYYGLLDAYDIASTRSKKRHAIYTPTLFMPNFDQPGPSNEESLRDTVSFNQLVNLDAICDARKNGNIKSCISYSEFANELHHWGIEHDITGRDDDALPHDPKYVVDDKTARIVEYLPISSPTHHLVHKSSSQSLRPASGLCYRKVSVGKRSVQFDPSRPQDIIRPQIVIDLLVDIDKAIEEWNLIY